MERTAVRTGSRLRSAASLCASVGLHGVILLLVATQPWASTSFEESVAVELVALPEPAKESPPEPEAVPPPDTPPPQRRPAEKVPTVRPHPIRKAESSRPKRVEPAQPEAAVVAEAPAEANISAAPGDAPKAAPVQKGTRHKDNYVAEIQARLVAVKRYPVLARSRNAEGVVVLAFSLDRSGALLAWRIDRKSGDVSLDDEAEAMVQRAAPYPPFPEALSQEKMELVVPINFTLKRG